MPTALPQALLFDMDGTLTCPFFDFAQIKRDIGLAEDQPILESIRRMPEAERARAEAILHAHEDAAARQSTLNEGCHGLLAWLRERGIPTALITRNSRRNVDIVCSLHDLRFDLLVTRETCTYKPDPTPLLLACETLGTPPTQSWMIGDSVHDIAAGLAARTPTVWISHAAPRPFAEEPWLTVPTLPALHALLRERAGEVVI